MNPSDISLGIPFPEGIPYLSGSFGAYFNKPNRLPLLHLFKDYDLFLIREGQAVWTFTGGHRMVAGKGCFAVMPPFTPAWIDEGKPGLVLHYCHFDFRPVPGELNPMVGKRLRGPGPEAFLPLVFPARRVPKLAKAYKTFMALDQNGSGNHWEMERQWLEVIDHLAHFAGECGKEAGKRAFSNPSLRRDKRVARIRTRIDEDPAQAWRVDELAESEDLSPGHLHGLCRKVLGCSLKTYIVDARLRLAVRLLKGEAEREVSTVREISEACGFASQHYFSRQFKKKFGVGPLAYRNGATIE